MAGRLRPWRTIREAFTFSSIEDQSWKIRGCRRGPETHLHPWELVAAVGLLSGGAALLVVGEGLMDLAALVVLSVSLGLAMFGCRHSSADPPTDS